MAKANNELPIGDEFDAYTRVFREVRFWRWVSLGASVLNLVLIFVILIQALQPPVVIVKDRSSSEAPSVIRSAEQPPVEVADAENFFIYVLRRRYGWESPTIMRDFEELHMLMTKEMGSAFAAYVNERIDPGTDKTGSTTTDPVTKMPRVFSWMKAMVRNSVSLDRADIECRKGEPVNGVDQWFCRGFGAIETMPMIKSMPEVAAERRRVEFRARFQPAPYDKSGVRIWGLGIAYLDALNTETDKK